MFLRCVGPPGKEKIDTHFASADTHSKLKEVVPPVLYIMGGDSYISTPTSNKLKVENTPIAELFIVPGTGHLVTFEKPTETGKFYSSPNITTSDY